jgi:hypothetical protein
VKDRIILKHLLILLGCTAYVLIVALTGIGCPFEYVTGIPCPGCGLTRAYVAFIRGNIVGAVRYHPLFWFLPLLLFVAFHGNTKMFRWLPKKGHTIFVIMGAITFFVLYLLRLLVFHNIPC